MLIQNRLIMAALACILACTVSARAQEAEVAQDSPLTVSGVVVDKTDKNAVLARAAAIAEARRAALRVLAERRMGAEAAASFKMPDDQTVATLVRDFEITDEQISATRYVGTFTIRFTSRAENYVGGPLPAPKGQGTPPPVSMPSGPRSVLILPYFETDAARLLLWEDSNAWLKAWQYTAPAVLGWTVVVPLGDINDVAAGSGDGVWSGDYAAIGKLLANYGVTDAILPVAAKGDGVVLVDLYEFRDGLLLHLPALAPIPQGENDDATLRAAVAQVMRALQNPVSAPSAAPLSDPPPPAPDAPETGVPVSIDVQMSFESAELWIEAQKRLLSMTPPATIGIKSLSSGFVLFTLGYSGSLETLAAALAAQGMEIGSPLVQVPQEGVATNDVSAPVYVLTFMD